MTYRRDWVRRPADRDGPIGMNKTLGRRVTLTASDLATGGNVVGAFTVPDGFVVTGCNVVWSAMDGGSALPGIAAPTLAITSPATDNMPDFTATGDLLAADTVLVQASATSGFAVIATVGNGMVSTPGTCTITDLGPLATGTWYFRAKTQRTGYSDSPYSNTVTITLVAAPGSEVPEPPIISITSASADTTPDFSVYLPVGYGTYQDVVPGDVLIIRKNTDPATSWSTYASRTLTAGDIAGTPLTLSGITPLSAGNYLFDAHFERGGSPSGNSNQLSHTVGGAFDPVSLFAGGEKGFYFDFTNTANLFQTEDTSSPVTATGQAIGRVTDLSGNGNHFIQATAGNRPTFRFADGFNCVEGGASRALTHSALNLNNSQWLSICIASRQNHGVAGGVWLEIGGSATVSLTAPAIRFGKFGATPPNVRLDVVGSAGAKITNYSFAEINDGGTGYEAHVLYGDFPFAATSTHIEFRLDGVAKSTTVTTGNTSATNLGTSLFAFLLTQSGLGQGSSSNRICAVVAVNRQLTVGERANLEAWCAAKCGATI